MRHLFAIPPATPDVRLQQFLMTDSGGDTRIKDDIRFDRNLAVQACKIATGQGGAPGHGAELRIQVQGLEGQSRRGSGHLEVGRIHIGWMHMAHRLGKGNPPRERIGAGALDLGRFAQDRLDVR